MIMSPTHRGIFVYMPKPAGTSISARMEPSLHWNDLVLGGTDLGERIQPVYRDRFGLSKHMPGQAIRRIVGPRVWENFFSFQFVRHPYTRLVSFYNWQRAAPSDPVGASSSTAVGA